MHHIVRRILFVAILFSASAAQAQWTGKAELGALASNGNTEAKSANAKLDLTHQGATVEEQLLCRRAVRRERRVRQCRALRSCATRRTGRSPTACSWFVGLRGEQDKFSGFAYQATASTGLTYKFVDNPTTKFDASVGAGYRLLQPQLLIKTDAGEVLQRIKGEEEGDPVGILGSNFEHAFTENTKITNKFLSEIGSENTSVQDDLALQVNMNEVLALAVGIGVRYNSDPPPLAESTDTLFTVNLVYNIK